MKTLPTNAVQAVYPLRLRNAICLSQSSPPISLVVLSALVARMQGIYPITTSLPLAQPTLLPSPRILHQSLNPLLLPALPNPYNRPRHKLQRAERTLILRCLADFQVPESRESRLASRFARLGLFLLAVLALAVALGAVVAGLIHAVAALEVVVWFLFAAAGAGCHDGSEIRRWVFLVVFRWV